MLSEAQDTPITGQTRVLMIVADPIAHVQTPQAINALARATGTDMVMVPCHADAAALPSLLAGLRGMQSLTGLVVTSPHKVAAAGLCDALGSQASRAGAVNAIRRATDGRLIGEIFDGVGFVQGLIQAGHRVEGRAVFLAGAGGAANAIAFALADAGVTRLVIHNRTPSKAVALAERVRRDYPATEVTMGDRLARDVDIAVNATSLGLKPDDPLPFDPSRLDPSAIVADVIMQPAITPLLTAAAKGRRVHPGQAMLDQQLSLLASFFGIANRIGSN